MIMPGPLYHNGPFTASFGGLNQGAHLIILPRFDAEETLKAIDRWKASWIYMVPTMMSRIWRLPEEVKAKYDTSTLKTAWHLAAPCPPWLKEAFIHWWGADTIMELYAGTEAQAVTIITGAEWLEHRGSVGKVAVGEMAAFDANGAPLPGRRDRRGFHAPARGRAGVLFLSWRDGPDVARWLGVAGRHRLFRRRGLSLPRRPPHRHDLGRRLQRLSGRDRIGAGRASPCAVERGDRHARRGPRQLASTPSSSPAKGLTEADLRAHIAGLLVTYKQPRTYEFVTENIRDDAGKVRRSQLRDERTTAKAL